MYFSQHTFDAEIIVAEPVGAFEKAFLINQHSPSRMQVKDRNDAAVFEVFKIEGVAGNQLVVGPARKLEYQLGDPDWQARPDPK